MNKIDIKRIIKEELDNVFHEASPQMKMDKDAQTVDGMLSMLVPMVRRAKGSNVKKELAKAIKVLQSLRSAIQVGR